MLVPNTVTRWPPRASITPLLKSGLKKKCTYSGWKAYKSVKSCEVLYIRLINRIEQKLFDCVVEWNKKTFQ